MKSDKQGIGFCAFVVVEILSDGFYVVNKT